MGPAELSARAAWMAVSESSQVSRNLALACLAIIGERPSDALKQIGDIHARLDQIERHLDKMLKHAIELDYAD